MEYLTIGNNKVSRLGFGCMRLPEKNGSIDYEESLKMAEYALENGINYFDTAYIYNSGESEEFVRQALNKFGRDKIFVADKLPMFYVNDEADFQKYLDEQLERLGTDYIDYYLFHCLNPSFFNIMKKFDYKGFIKKNKDAGKIKYIGFSFHAEAASFKEIIDDYDWDFCQIQFNYLDTDYQAGLEGYEYATKRNIPVIVMGPIRGGTLAKMPAPTKKLFKGTSLEKLTPAEIALKYVADYPNIKVILSGMSSIEEMKSNITLFNQELINTLTTEEKQKYIKAKESFFGYNLINCTECDYCKNECPSNIPISEIFSRYNSDLASPNFEHSEWYNDLDEKATSCIECGACETSCPQHLNIVERLKTVDEYFSDQ